MGPEEKHDMERTELEQRIRTALLGLGEFGTGKDSENILFFNTESMLTCELLFEEIQNVSNSGVIIRCSTSVGTNKLVAHFSSQTSANSEFEKFSRELLKAAVRSQTDLAVKNKQREIRRALGMEN